MNGCYDVLLVNKIKTTKKKKQLKNTRLYCYDGNEFIL